MRVSHLTIAATLAITALGTAGCDSAADHEPPAPATVRVATAVAGPAAPTIRTNGLLANQDEIRLSFKVGGIIERITVREGERVRKGQRLAEIEQTEIDAQVEQTRQAYEKAQRDLRRGERLHADQVISLEQLQDLRTQTAVAEAALQAAEFNLSYAAIVAPRDGTIMRRLAEERELVPAGTPVFVFGALDEGFVVRTGLADREIVQVRLGDPARIRMDALPGVTLHGRVFEIASAADPANGMFPVSVALEPVDLPLKSGLVASLAISPSTAQAGTRTHVPIASIVEGNGNTASVFVFENGNAHRRAVQVAFIDNDSVALLSGLAPGERIVTEGALFLEDGEPVTGL